MSVAVYLIIILSVLHFCDSDCEIDGVDVKLGAGRSFNGVVFKTARRYYHAMEMRSGWVSFLLVRGGNTWKFPLQDVNLTLSYPPDNDPYDHIITSIEVFIYMDGVESKGFLKSGGIMEDNVTMVYLLPNITMLSYRFEVYGTPKRIANSDWLSEKFEDLLL